MIKKIAADNIKFKSAMPEKKALEMVPIDHGNKKPTEFDLEVFKCHN